MEISLVLNNFVSLFVLFLPCTVFCSRLVFITDWLEIWEYYTLGISWIDVERSFYISNLTIRFSDVTSLG